MPLRPIYSQDKIATIFERFTQADNATTRNFGGTGLGLSIAKKLAELQGGEITLISNPNQGSEFCLKIMYDIADSEQYISKSDRTSNSDFGIGKRALIVEDNPLNQKLMEMLLAEVKIETQTVANGELALQSVSQNIFDVILMDIQMPIMDGYETTKRIRNEMALNIPIIAMTANAMAGEYEKCISSGMEDYITKPFKAETLYDSLKKVFHKEHL